VHLVRHTVFSSFFVIPFGSLFPCSALKTKGNTPKYGLIFHSTFIGRAAPKNKGRISRYLANKCAVAARIDCFAENPTQTFGIKLREQVEERLVFYETGAAPRKNIDVMRLAVAENLAADGAAAPAAGEKKKKRKSDIMEVRRPWNCVSVSRESACFAFLILIIA
jgi:RNA processing factor Prp31